MLDDYFRIVNREKFSEMILRVEIIERSQPSRLSSRIAQTEGTTDATPKVETGLDLSDKQKSQ